MGSFVSPMLAIQILLRRGREDWRYCNRDLKAEAELLPRRDRAESQTSRERRTDELETRGQRKGEAETKGKEILPCAEFNCLIPNISGSAGKFGCTASSASSGCYYAFPPALFLLLLVSLFSLLPCFLLSRASLSLSLSFVYRPCWCCFRFDRRAAEDNSGNKSQLRFTGTKSETNSGRDIQREEN
jgi:hypothetical protein